VTLDGGLDWILDLLTTCTHNTESNYSAIANLHSLQITTAHAKSSPACCVFTSRSLVTASNTEGSLASVLKSSLREGSVPTDSFVHRLPYRTELVATVVFLISLRHGPRRQHTVHSHMLTVSAEMCLPSRSLAAAVYFCLLRILCLATDNFRCLFRGLCVETNVSEPFVSNGCFFGSTILALSKYATISIKMCGL
jgi:hypothetical protein